MTRTIKDAQDMTAPVLRRLLHPKHRLAEIDISARPRGVTARAIPEHHHPIVAARREAAFAAAGGDVSMAQASKIAEDAWKEPLARGQGPTILDALKALEAQLKAPKE